MALLQRLNAGKMLVYGQRFHSTIDVRIRNVMELGRWLTSSGDRQLIDQS